MSSIPNAPPHQHTLHAPRGTVDYWPQASSPSDAVDAEIPVAFVGTYGPRRCGIATFTADLALAVAADDRRVSPDGARRHRTRGTVPVPRRGQVRDPAERQSRLRPRRGVRQLQPACAWSAFSTSTAFSAATTAATFSISSRRCACPQSSRCTRCSSVRPRIKPRSCGRCAERCAQLVVMSQIAQGSARKLVRRRADRRCGSFRTAFPCMDRRRDQQALKAEFGVAGRRLLLTFGLLSPQQRHRDGDPCAARRGSPLPGRHLLRRRRHASGHRSARRRSVSNAARARGREARRARARGRFAASSSPTRSCASYLQAADVFVSPVSQRGAGDERRAVLRDGRGRRRGVDAVLARAGVARGRPRLLVSFQGSRGLESARCSSCSARPRSSERVRDAAFAFAQSMAWPRDRRRLLRDHAQHGAHGRARARRASAAQAARREQLAGSVPRPSAANDRRHRHHPARRLQRARAQHGLLRRRQCARADRGACTPTACRQARRRARSSLATQLSARVAAAGRQLSQLHELRARSRLGAGVRRLHRARDLGARRHRDARGRRGLPPARARDARRARCRIRGDLGPRGTAQVVLGLVSVLAVEPGAAEERRLLDGLVAKLLERLSRQRDGRLALVRVHAHLRQRDPAARAVRRVLA